jgi:hypothetical protein
MTVEAVVGPSTTLRRQLELKNRELSGGVESVKMEPAEIAAVNERMKQLGLLLQEQVRAKYKIEIHFGKNRTSRGQPFAGAISLWLSGTKFHGGGDEKIYECPRPDCGAIILPDAIDNNRSICHGCGGVWPAQETIGERLLKLTEQDWAYAILRLMQKLELNCDLYAKYSPDDIRYRTAMEMARNRGGEEIAKARRLRGLTIYPLKNVIKDTKNGADLYTRVRAFINA